MLKEEQSFISALTIRLFFVWIIPNRKFYTYMAIFSQITKSFILYIPPNNL